MEFITLPLRICKTHSEGIDTFNIGIQCFQCSAKMLALHLAEFFTSTVGRSLEFVVVKKKAKNLEMTITKMNGPRGEFSFSFGKIRT